MLLRLRARVRRAFRDRWFFFAELKTAAARLRAEVHRLAATYHWSEPDIHRLSRARRLAYLALIEADEDADLLATFRG
ncbi:hypothetical protein G6O69_04305 [Pseudenhygromyxa sp. WMMC2535]|uniref:hypothetical protein n=1 Tax=Pseudenhygromyxa sp. WMMC2535 TaxID=2712867 RepID=UPI00159626E6|nr:hypothetical protein [Pseudenhygromyxa sp. WMMC2535]NVB37040.1 hypothetical protein [Pseudenhygromyxa sp. WMMC2535]